MAANSKVLQSMFLWGIDREIISRYTDTAELMVATTDQPVLAVMNRLTNIYCSVMKGDWYEDINRKISDLETVLQEINEKEQLAQQSREKCPVQSEKISLEVLMHVAWSSLYHVKNYTHETEAARQVYQILPSSVDYSISDLNKATLYGCKAIVLSNFPGVGYRKARALLELVIDTQPQCPLWHWLLYRNRRCERLNSRPNAKPSEEERRAIIESTRYSENSFYALHRAQMHLDFGETEKALYQLERAYRNQPESFESLLWLADELLRFHRTDLARTIYNKVYQSKPQNIDLLLRLGDGLMVCWNLAWASNCLEKVRATNPDHPLYREYRRELDRRETLRRKYVSDMEHAVMNKKTVKTFDMIGFLKRMLSDSQEIRIRQYILLHLGINYHRASEFTKSCESFLEAMQIDQHSPVLKNFTNRLSTKRKSRNIFSYILAFLPECERTQRPVRREVVAELRRLCQDNLSVKPSVLQIPIHSKNQTQVLQSDHQDTQ